MRLKLNILLITLLALLSCAKEGGGRVDYGPETGDLCVRFDVSDMNPPILGVTKDNADAGHVLSEDGVMRKGRMWLVDKDDKVVVFGEMGVNNSTSTEHEFTNIKRGEYKLYILLNSTELDGFKKGETINEDFKQKCLTLLKPNSSSEAPEYFESPEYTVESGVPCSIVKDVAIAAGKNYVDVSLQRCVGRLTVVVLNNIHDCQLAIGGIGLSAVNPSMGYYFPQSDGSVPTYTDRAFHDLDYKNPVVLPPSKNKIIFDRYVYETKEISEGLSFRLFGAVYKDGATVTPSSFNSYTFTGNQSLGKDKKYFLRSAASASRNYYIGVLNDGGLGCDEFLDDEELIRNPKIENFLWTVEGTSDPRTLKNVGTEKCITLNSTGTQVDLGLGDSGTSFYFIGSTTSGYLISSMKQQKGSWWEGYYYDYGYGLACDPESARGLVAIDSPDTKTNTSWVLREATLDNSKTYPEYQNCVCEIPYRQHAINYIDDYAVSKLLTRIKRNEHVTVSINVSYDREYMQFGFEVKAWATKDNKTTFD